MESGARAETGIAAGQRQERRGGGPLTVTVVAVAVGVVLTIVVLLMVQGSARTPPNAPIEILPPPPAPTRGPTATPVPWRVYVTGAVNRPGIVQLLPAARVEDAIAAAGGPAADADLENYNMAAPLFDGQHLRVPIAGETPCPPALPEGVGAPTAQRLNINSATAEELTALPGVGEATAAEIVAYRQEHGPFARVEEIMDVPGIGQSKFDGFKEAITVGP